MRHARLFYAGFMAAGMVVPQAAHAFSEDLCVDETNGRIVSCQEDAACNPFLGPTFRCRIHLFQDSVNATTAADAGKARSMLHMDTTYFLGRAAGLSHRAAYWIAAYNEVTDIGKYVPMDIYGQPVEDDPSLGPVSAVEFNGWQRSFPYTSAWSYHMPAPYQREGEQLYPNCAGDPPQVPPPNAYPICGAEPDLHDEVHEGLVIHYRDWAFGNREDDIHDVCAGGLTDGETDSHYCGSTCYQADPRLTFNSSEVPKYVQGDIPLLKGVDKTLPFEAFTGRQIARFSPPDTVMPIPLPGMPMPDLEDVQYADDLESIIEEELPPAELEVMLAGNSLEEYTHLIRMGIYLHVLQDRISHHVCGDLSSLTGPNADGFFYYGYDDQECGQDMHAYYHYTELGQRKLPLRTYTSLEYTYSELMLFNQAFPMWADSDPLLDNEVYMTTLVEDLAVVLKVKDGCERLKAMIQLTSDYGFEQLPGNDASPEELAGMCD